MSRIEVGDRAPEFELRGTGDRTMRLADVRGRWLVLAFYPGDSYGVLGPGGIVRRSIFIVDPEGIVRYRQVALLGLRYQDVEDLKRSLQRAQAETPA
jgi:peroxiredoxin Q/BCP